MACPEILNIQVLKLQVINCMCVFFYMNFQNQFNDIPNDVANDAILCRWHQKGKAKASQFSGTPLMLHLVVCPLSILINWCREVSKWCPELRVLKFHGSKDQGGYTGVVLSQPLYKESFVNYW